MAFTEFYCDTATGSNINAGDDKTVVTSTNGDWGNAAANRFTAAAGTPFSGVSVGDFASVYLDGATLAVYIGRVTAVNAGGASLDISSTAKSGTAPTTGATGRSCTVGGKWKGPNAAEAFPFGFVQSTMTNASGDIPWVNIKAGTYTMTAAITHANNGAMGFSGYTSTVRDGGKWTLDGATTGASYIPLTISGTNVAFTDFIVSNNGATGSASGLVPSGAGCFISRGVVHDVRGVGVSCQGTLYMEEIETYACNTSNTSNLAGLDLLSTNSMAVNCISHDNTGSNAHGFMGRTGYFVNCIAESNGGKGFQKNASGALFIMLNCDSYNNTGDNVTVSTSGPDCVVVRNGLISKGSAWGINLTGGNRIGRIINTAFGAGTQANSSGNINAPTGILESGTINLTSNIDPYVDAPNGDFDLNNTSGGGALCRGSGRGSFTQTASSYAGTQGYPDIGAAQHQETPSTGGGSYSF